MGVGVRAGVELGTEDINGDKRVFGEKIKYNMSKTMKNEGINISKAMVIVFTCLFLGACGVEKAGVEIVSEPIAKVYLNGKESGTTPYKNNTLKPGEIEIKLDDRFGNFWERKIKLESNVTSVINWTFDGVKDGGYILSMEKTGKDGSILVNSNPGGAMVYIDGELKINTPAKIENIGEGDKKLSISFPGYKSINLIIKVVKGYQLIVDAKLEKEERVDTAYSISPVPTTSLGPKIRIKETETGWLRVRSVSNNGGVEIGKANPGELYELIDEINGWYQIKFEDKEGWVSAKYAEKISE